MACVCVCEAENHAEIIYGHYDSLIRNPLTRTLQYPNGNPVHTNVAIAILTSELDHVLCFIANNERTTPVGLSQTLKIRKEEFPLIVKLL